MALDCEVRKYNTFSHLSSVTEHESSAYFKDATTKYIQPQSKIPYGMQEELI